MSDTLGTLERIADALERIAAALQSPVAIPVEAPPTPADAPTLAQLKLTTRTRNALCHAPDYYKLWGRVAPKTLADIAEWSRAEFLRLPNFGHVSYIEVWRLCVEHGYWAPDDAALAPEARILRRVEAKERAGKWRPPQSAAA